MNTNFETNPLSGGGWAALSGLGPADWTTEQSFSPTHSIKAHDGGYWFGPGFATQSFSFYKATFKSRTTNGGGTWGTPDNNRPRYTAGAGWQDNESIFRAQYNAPASQLAFNAPATGTAYIDDVQVQSITRAQAATELDEFYEADMYQFDFITDPNRHDNLSGTIQKLNSGQHVRTVMLGDSIVADTYHSYFDPLIDRLYPGSGQLDVIPSVRGATGAWFYQNDVQTWVLDHDPDLVMIGGISHNNDIDAVESVIDQIRTADPNIDIILMSEAAGYSQPAQAIGAVDPNGTEWRSQLYQLAEQENVEFFDMWQNWVNYVVESGQPYSDYLRDAIHMNDAGSQIVGRALEAYFTGGTYGDADRDGDVDLADLGALASNYGDTSGEGWRDGDFDNDGDVDLTDLGSLATNYAAGEAQAWTDFQAIAGIPEPSAAFGVLSLFLGYCGRRRRC